MADVTCFRHNLPAQVSRFIGREQELREITAYLSGHRLVTLTGAGGTGKTRLALQAATAELARFADGVWLMELAPLSRAELVGETLATVLSLPETAEPPLLERLCAWLQAKHLLLVLDNCEHLLDACAQLVSLLLARCPHLTVLTTSREPLTISGEVVMRVPSLRLPEQSEPLDPAHLLHYDAIQLFVERAQATEPSFRFSEVTAGAVVEICRRLDGIPLALELAAGRVRGMGVAYLGARLSDRFRFLTGGDRAAAPRQQTLHALIDWSYNLLPEPERVVLRRLGVFVGSFSHEAAEAVCIGDYEGAGGRAAVSAGEVFDDVTRLVDKSLVQFDQETNRYRLLETIRFFCLERLTEARETQYVSRQHFAWYLQLAEEGAALFGGHRQEAWFTHLEQEHDNLRSALGWAIQAGRADEATRLALSLWRFWHSRIYQQEGVRWLEQILALDATSPIPASLRPRLLNALGVLANAVRHFDRAAACQTEALRLWTEAGDEAGMAQAMMDIGWQHFQQVDLVKTKQCAVACLPLAERTGDKRLIAGALQLNAIADLHADISLLFDYDAGAKVDHHPLLEVIPTLERSRAIWCELGDTGSEASTIALLGLTYQGMRDYERAKPLLAESIRLHLRLGNYGNIDGTFVALMNLAANMSDTVEMAQDSARMFGVLLASGERIATQQSPWDSSEPARRLMARLIGVIGQEGFEQALAEGKALTTDGILALVARITAPNLRTLPLSPHAVARAPYAALTPREVDVLRLVATGLTNAQVAQRLIVTPRTINAHLTAIYSKLGVTSRAGAIRYALVHQLG